MPSEATALATMKGLSRTPPFATAAMAMTVCRPEADSPCPNETVSTAMFGIRAGSGTEPRASPGRPTPVRSPKPKARSAVTRRCLPSASPIFAAQMLEDSRSTTGGVAQATLCVSWMRWPNRSQMPFSQKSG